MKRNVFAWLSALLALPVLAAAEAGPTTPAGRRLLDDFDRLEGWGAFPADGVQLNLRSDAGWRGQALRMDFAFTGGGYAVARKAFDIDLPDNYAFTFRVRGDGRPNHLEFKLLDDTGQNVWWHVRRDFEFPKEWTLLTTKKRQISFAWGPAGGELHHLAAIEIVVTAGQGGSGSVWIDDLALTPLPPAGPPRFAPVVHASSGAADAARVVDGSPNTAWRPEPQDLHPGLVIDYGEPREFGGLKVVWNPNAGLEHYLVEASDDSLEWRLLYERTGPRIRTDWACLPESEARYLRLGPGPGRPWNDRAFLAELELLPLALGASREAFFQAIAADSPPGYYPRGFQGQPSYWTVVGVDNDTKEVLFNTDGAIETGRQQCSIEPFIYDQGRPKSAAEPQTFENARLLTWADGVTSQVLPAGFLPAPAVVREVDSLNLTVFATGAGEPGDSWIIVHYSVENRRSVPADGTLYLAARPFQVNPPAQFLNFAGGCARVDTIAVDTDYISANGDTVALFLPATPFFVTRPFAAGDLVREDLRGGGRLEGPTAVRDPFGAASAAMAWPYRLEPGNFIAVDMAIPLHRNADRINLSRWSSYSWTGILDGWAQRTMPAGIQLPPSARSVYESLRAQLNYILINRAGPAIQPGTRAYARSWIRDGALTSSALLRLGRADVVRDFLTWFAPHQYPGGKIPCVVDWRGADPVPEHDSNGEFIFLVAEYFRYTGDRELTGSLWPRVAAAAAWLDSLRHERMTAEYRARDKAEFYGMLPPSISHEGYSARPMHSYWDGFFAYKGFADAAWLAGELGHPGDAARWARVRDEFGRDLAKSVAATQKKYRIDYVPGCADLGDFDATSTTIAWSPTGVAGLLPRRSLEATFERYWQFFTDRKNGAPWEAFTPYEIRNIGAFIRLGWRDRARDLTQFFLDYQKPVAWRQWPEVVWHDETTPHYLGDLPHGWVGSDFIRSVLDMLAYVREDGRALVLGAGLPMEWLAEDPGVAVDHLPTPWGPLSYRMKKIGASLRVEIDEMPQKPPAGIVLRLPLPGPSRDIAVATTPVKLDIPLEGK